MAKLRAPNTGPNADLFVDQVISNQGNCSWLEGTCSAGRNLANYETHPECEVIKSFGESADLSRVSFVEFSESLWWSLHTSRTDCMNPIDAPNDPFQLAQTNERFPGKIPLRIARVARAPRGSAFCAAPP